MNVASNALLTPVLTIAAMAAIAILAYRGGKRHQSRMLEHGVRVAGVVVGNKIQWGRITTVRPVVRFVTEDGQTIEARETHGVATAIPSYFKGTAVTVQYDRENPTEFEIISTNRRLS